MSAFWGHYDVGDGDGRITHVRDSIEEDSWSWWARVGGRRRPGRRPGLIVGCAGNDDFVWKNGAECPFFLAGRFEGAENSQVFPAVLCLRNPNSTGLFSSFRLCVSGRWLEC